MVFDTETNGLFPKINLTVNENGELESLPAIDKYPYLLQLAYIVYDVKETKIIESFNKYIRISSSVEIPDYITKINGITHDVIQNGNSINIEDAIYRFYKAYTNVDIVIGHNVAFDKKVIEIEVQRNKDLFIRCPSIYFMFNDTFNSRNGISVVCSMEMSKNYCNILIEKKSNTVPTNETETSKKPQFYKKPPKLEELHEKLFGYKPQNLHDAMVDTFACLRCYLKLQFEIELEEVAI
jgi:DNA polymerase III epsilon subunit-like protein